MLIKELNNIYLLKEQIVRNSLNDFYWPAEYKILQRENLILNREWYEGWFCNFSRQGLQLDVNYFISESQWLNWPKVKSLNLNIKKTEVEFKKSFTVEVVKPAICFTHSSKKIEHVRKKIYISNNFKQRAENMWACQFYHNNKNDSDVIYSFGFTRDVCNSDKTATSKIKQSLITDPAIISFI